MTQPATSYRAIVEEFDEASPQLVAQRLLLRRTDTKYALPAAQLDAVLAPLADHYRVLRANGRAVATYRTLYLDTPDLRCFHDHRRGCRPRHKVRFRHYVDRELTFLEVKTKRSEHRTDKQRSRCPYQSTELSPADLEFIARHTGLPAATLAPQVWTDFARVTLVGTRTAERLTIDTDLELRRDRGGRLRLAGVAIVEVKQAPMRSRTPAMLQLRRAGHHPVSASKYCTASALWNAGLRSNRLLPAIRLLERLRS